MVCSMASIRYAELTFAALFSIMQYQIRTRELPELPTDRLRILALSLVFIFLLSLLMARSFATEWECGERSNLPQEGKNYCAAGDFRHAEAKLQKMLAALIKQFNTSNQDAGALQSVQKAFEANRAKQCETENKHAEDKAYHPMMVAQCKTRLTNLYIDELDGMKSTRTTNQ